MSLKRSFFFCLAGAFVFLSGIGEVIASRVPELEEHFIARVSHLLQMRFPNTPFTVFVTLDTGKETRSRKELKEVRRGEGTGTRLPYLDIDEEEIDIWDRPDLPIGTLISQLQSIKIRVQIDSSLNDSQLNEIKDNIARQLKLDERYDAIEVTRMNWSVPKQEERSSPLILVYLFVGLMVAGLVLYLIARVSIQGLVKGLAKPISEVGRSTAAMAKGALAATSPDPQSSATPREADSELKDAADGLSLVDIRKNALELLERNRLLFENPDSRFMSFIETKGAEDPPQMGAILAELDEKSLKYLFKFGIGEWWFTALSQPAPMTSTAVQILSEVDRLRLRRHFFDESKLKSYEEYREAGLIFGRLSNEQLISIFRGNSMEMLMPIFELMPRQKALAVAKRVFPGQWATLLDQKKDVPTIDKSTLESLMSKAIREKPLRSESELYHFFLDQDLIRYLDLAPPDDEREFYTVLPYDSNITRYRTPFFKVFESPDDVLRLIGPHLTSSEWAVALADCDIRERNTLMTHFPDRMKFMIREHWQTLDPEKIDEHQLRVVRRKIVKAYEEISELIAAQSGGPSGSPDSQMGTAEKNSSGSSNDSSESSGEAA